MKILSTFTHPQVVANLYEFLSSAEHKGRYTVCTKEVNGAKQLLVPNFSQNISLCVQQKKETHTGLQQLEGE